MAFWQRDKRGYVFVFTRKDGKQKKLPRAKTKHLDPLTNNQIQQWVDNWSTQYEGKKVQEDNILFLDSKLSRYVADYIKFLEEKKKKSPVTCKQQQSMLRRFGLPFFLSHEPPLKDPQMWPSVSIKLMDYLEERGVTPNVIFRTNIALRGLFHFLQEERLVEDSLKLHLRTPVKEHQDTPLQYALGPKDVIEFAKNPAVPEDVRLMALLGYFFSLRPQECFALARGDFKAGSAVQTLDAARAMARVRLYSKLAVNVSKQRTNLGAQTNPKKGSKGWVCCFNEDAARLTVGLLKKVDLLERVVPFENREQYKRWHQSGIKDITLKDLRRASLYWLGHFSDLSPIELMKHARHQRLETTMIYLRRPEEALESTDLELDLEA